MKKKNFVILAFGLLVAFSSKGQLKELEPGEICCSGPGSNKACVLTFINPGKPPKAECRGVGTSCGTVDCQ